MAENTAAIKTYYKCHSEKDLYNLSLINEDILYVVSPNLPFGYECLGAVDHIISNGYKGIVIIDEAYVEFGSGQNAVYLLKKYPQQIILIRTFSKFFGLAALRLGYLVTGNNQIYEELKIMHNGKNITRIAAKAAETALQNLDFYNLQLDAFHEVQKYLNFELCNLPSNGIIYNYNLQHGNFFLIYSTLPNLVCEQFLKIANIAIRDKSSEIPDAIRISIAPLEIMKKVIKVIKFINFNYKGFLLDLDGTLRIRAKLSSPLVPGVRDFLDSLDFKKIKIVTNNTIDSDEDIMNQLYPPFSSSSFSNIDISRNIKIYRPQIPKDTFLISSGSSNSTIINEENCTSVTILNSVLDVGTDVWAKAAKIVSKGHPVNVVEDSEDVTLDMCGETTLNGKEKIPDVGTFLSAMKWNYNIIGKPNIPIDDIDNKWLMIGDSDNDRKFAEKHNIDFVKIVPSVKYATLIDDVICVPDFYFLVLSL